MGTIIEGCAPFLVRELSSYIKTVIPVNKLKSWLSLNQIKSVFLYIDRAIPTCVSLFIPSLTVYTVRLPCHHTKFGSMEQWINVLQVLPVKHVIHCCTDSFRYHINLLYLLFYLAITNC